MPTYLNLHNGITLTVTEAEAPLYERATNWERVDQLPKVRAAVEPQARVIPAAVPKKAGKKKV